MLVDEQGIIIEWNRGEEQINGLRRADAIGRSIWDVQFAFLPEEHRSPAAYEQIKTMYLESLPTGQLPWLNQLAENTIQRPDETRRIIQARTFSIGTNRGYMYGSISRDMTEHKQAEEALRVSEARFRALIENSTDLITLLGADGTILYASPSTTRVLGYTPEEYIGRSGFERVHPAEIEDLSWLFSELLQKPGGVINAQYRIGHKDGSWRWMEGVGKNMPAESGVRAIVVNSRDVTERKRAEEALRQAQKMESLGVLAGGVAHDFNDLLVAMLGQASLALRQMSAENPARRYVEKVVTAAERAADLTRQMLAYSGGGRFEMRPLRLNALLRENLHLFEVAVPKNVQLHPELTEPLPLIEGDVGQMQQVIMNLIIHAAEAIGERPGTVLVTAGKYTVNAEDDRLWQYTGEPLAPGEYVILEVRDDGSGMDVETLQKIFDPFFTTKFIGRGWGWPRCWASRRAARRVRARARHGVSAVLPFHWIRGGNPDHVNAHRICWCDVRLYPRH